MPPSSPDSSPLIFVTVGTDHHPFDRLIRWVDAWIEAGGGERARCFVQTGTSAPPLLAEWKDFLQSGAMAMSMREAAAVVCHGGSGTVMDCRHEGLVPIVVPRRSRLGEHVDDHQMAFAKRMAELGQIHLAETDDQLWQLLERAIDEPAAFRSPQALTGETDAVERFEDLVEALLRRPTKTREAIGQLLGRSASRPSSPPATAPPRAPFAPKRREKGQTFARTPVREATKGFRAQSG